MARWLLLFCLIGLLIPCVYSASALLHNTATIQSTTDRLTPQPDQEFIPDFPSQNTLTINPKQTYQSIIGFGGAITDAATYVFNQLTPDQQQQVLDSYYGSGPNSNRYTLGRIPMNSCDFARYSYNFANVSGDYNLDHFDHQVPHDQEYMIPFVKKALAQSRPYHPLKLFLTPWSPPAWMKVNQQMDSSALPLGLLNDTRVYQGWAKYYVEFMRAYASFGIDFWGLTIQNESEFAAPWEANVYTPEAQRDFVKNYLGPTLQASEFFNVKVMFWDHNKDHMQHWANVIASDPQAMKYIWGIALHWYTGPEFANVAATHAAWPELNMLATEACTCPLIKDNWAAGEAYGNDILGDLNNWVRGWTDWNFLLDQQGGPNHLKGYCDAPIFANLTTSPPTLHYQPQYYYLGQFSRFLPPDSIRIDHSYQYGGNNANGTNLLFTTFLTHPENWENSNIVIVVLNLSNQQEEFKLSLSSSLAAPVVSPPHSIQTLTFQTTILG